MKADLGYVEPWNDVIAEAHYANTERMLLGACGPARVVGNRVTEAILVEREQRAEAMTARINARKVLTFKRKEGA